MLVTPGYLPPNNTRITPAQLRQVATPSVEIQDEEITPSMIDLPALSTALEVNAGKTNYLANPNFNPAGWPRGAGPIVSPTAIYTELAQSWAVKPAAGRITQQQSIQVTTVAADAQKSLYSLQILGDTSSTGTVELKQDILRYLSAGLRATIALSFHLYNGTGADITPTISFSTPAAADDFTTVAEVDTESCGPCVNTVWTKVIIDSIDASAWANLDFGLRVSLVLPTACLNNTGKSVYVSQFKLELVAVTEYLPTPEPLLPVSENYFQNYNMDLWALTSTALTTSAGTNNFAALNWFCIPTSGTSTIQRSTDQALTGSAYSAKITGGGSTDFGQTILGGETKQSLTFSAWIYNGTAAEITPTLRLDLVGGANQFSSTLTPCPVSAWTRVTAIIPAGSYAITSAGVNVYLRMSITATQSIYITQAKLEPGTVLSRPRRIVEAPVPQPLYGYRNLLIRSTGSTSITVTADTVVALSESGIYRTDSNLNDTITFLTTGVGALDYAAPMTAATWHYVYAICNGSGGVRAILSKSATAPTLPTGYLYWVRLGAVIPDSTTTVTAIKQLDNKAFCPIQTTSGGFLQATSVGTANSLVGNADISGIVPPIAKTIYGLAGVTASGVSCGMILATDNSGSISTPYIGLQAINCTAHASVADFLGYFGSGRFELPYNHTVWWTSTDTSSNKRADITGWTL